MKGFLPWQKQKPLLFSFRLLLTFSGTYTVIANALLRTPVTAVNLQVVRLCAFRLPQPRARDMLDAGVIVALGSDFNPNAYCCSMVRAARSERVKPRLPSPPLPLLSFVCIFSLRQ